MKVFLEFEAELGQAFQGEQVSPAAFRMAAMAEAFKLTLLAWTQATGSSAEVRLLQRPSNQAPADRSPRVAPGRRVR